MVNHSGMSGSKSESQRKQSYDAPTKETAAEQHTASVTPKPKKKACHSLPVFVRSDFQVGSMMGEGSFATVHKAKHLASGRDVAIKVVRPESELDIGPGPNGSSPAVSYKDVLNAMKLEVSMLETIGRHPNVIEILGAAEDCKVFVMERAASDLYSIVKHQEKHLPLQLAAQWTEQICRAVEYCHERGIVHQDIKSSNILVLSDRTAKICDFGLARKGSKVMHVDRELVTLWYRAPELLMGDSTYNVKVDEWGVGCIVLEMIIGGCPFRGKPECVCSCPQTTHRNYNSDQLMKIFAMTGTPKDKTLLARMSCHQHFARWPNFPRKIESTVMKCVTLDRCATWKAGRPKSEHDLEVIANHFIGVIAGLVHLDPDRRISCAEAIVRVNSTEAYDSPSGPRSPGTEKVAPKTPTAGPNAQSSPTAAERSASKALQNSKTSPVDGPPAEDAASMPTELVRREAQGVDPDTGKFVQLKQDPRHAKDGPRELAESEARRKSVTPTNRRMSSTIPNPTADTSFARIPSAPVATAIAGHAATSTVGQKSPETQTQKRRSSVSPNGRRQSLEHGAQRSNSGVARRDSVRSGRRDSLDKNRPSPPGRRDSAEHRTAAPGRYLDSEHHHNQHSRQTSPNGHKLHNLSPTHFVTQTPKGTESASKKNFFSRTPSTPSNTTTKETTKESTDRADKKEALSATSRMRSWLRRSSS
eukprot:CAMPEP_0184309004 /NCGR_PEP_ID=MMETSP1049-20130417/17305_1 /TAXON_ID=77928 /ORGANISM="Proteomonas sulcata, Strain CCMP704" /LENGTH=700 /DNA_ID=CAMNT_0026621809 /DNA_START=95 /DNA_END=2197 /DNA_ORIENTATION=+